MELAKHCELCDHQKISLQQGTTCGLTNRKPEFNGTCSKIALHQKFEDKLKQLNIDYQKLNREKGLTYTYFIVLLGIGVAIAGGGFLFGHFIYKKGFISTVPIIISSASLAPFTLAFGTLNNYKQALDVAKSKKDNIDQVLAKYRITYDIDITFGKEYHGTQEIQVDLKTKGIRS